MEELLADSSAFLLRRALPCAATLIPGLFLIRVLLRLAGKTIANSKLDPAAHTLVKTMLRACLYLLLLLLCAAQLGLDVTGIVALAGVLTLSVSLALQNALGNLLGGITLLYTKPFHAGDYVEVAGQSGSVAQIGLTYTSLTTPDNKSISIPNSAVTAAQIINYTSLGVRRVDITVPVSYTASVETVLSALCRAAQVPAQLKDKAPLATVERYGTHRIFYTLRVWCPADSYWDTRFAVLQNIKSELENQGIPLYPPQLDVKLDKNT